MQSEYYHVLIRGFLAPWQVREGWVLCGISQIVSHKSGECTVSSARARGVGEGRGGEKARDHVGTKRPMHSFYFTFCLTGMFAEWGVAGPTRN